MIGLKLKINTGDFTASRVKYQSGAENTFFLTHQFANGFYLGFYSGAPWGRVHDQERGLVIIDPKKKEIIDTCETFYWGHTEGGYREWRKATQKQYGKLTLLKDKWGNRPWKMNE